MGIKTAITLSLFAFLTVGLPAVESAQSSSWLDRAEANWNKAGAAIPIIKSTFEERCRDAARKPDSVIDKELTAAGWTLFGPVQSYEGTAVIRAMGSSDGMCRPSDFQVFAFVDGRFAGTLTPSPIDSRADGVASRIWLTDASHLTVEFSRYKSSDALCCPSGTTSVSYTITRTPEGPLVVPGEPTKTQWQSPQK